MASAPPVLTDDDIMRFRGQSAQPPAIPRVIQGPPREPPPQTEVNTQRDRVALDLERQRLDLQRAQIERERLAAQQAGRVAADPAGDAPATQRRDAGFYLRAARSNGLYEQHQVEPRGVVGQTLADAFPRIANANADPERQVAEAAQADFIGATLRYESGAAVPPAELEQQRMRYFPQPGDSPDVIAFKATLRRNAIEALQRSAGPAANGIDISLPRDQMSPNGQLGAGALDAGAAALRGAGHDVPHGPSGPASAPTSGPGGGLTVTDPRESGMAAGVPQQANQEVAATAAPGTLYAGPLSNRFNAEFQAAVNAGASREDLNNLLRRHSDELTQAYQMLGRLYPGVDFGQHDPGTVPDDLWRRIESSRRAGRTLQFTPAPLDPQPGGGLLSSGMSDAGAAGVANALDSASFGAPNLVSGDYSRRLGNLRENHPVASTIGALAGGLVAPGGPRPGMGLLEQSARSGAQGAVYGFGESGGDPEAALAGFGIGAAAPGAFNVAGRAARPVTNALTSPFRRGAVSPEQNALAQALRDEGIPGSRPLLDPTVRDRMAYLESSAGSGGPIRAGLDATRRGVEAGAGRLGAGGTVEEVGTMGQRVQDAGQRYIDQSRTQATRLYDRASSLAGDTPIHASDAVAEIDDQLSRLRRNEGSNGGRIKLLEELRGDLVDANGNLIPKSVADIRDIRTGLRDRINQHGLTFNRVERQIGDILDRARGDIERDLGGANAPAVQAYRRADEFYAQRAGEIRQVIQRVIGPRDNPLSGEQVMARIRTMASSKGDIGRLNRMMAHFTPEERADIAATIAEGAGQRSANEPFSPARFVTWANTLSPRAQAAFFGRDGAQSIQNLSRISQALDATQKSLNNTRSGVVSNWRGWLRDLTGGGPVGFVAGLAGGGSATASGLAGAAIGGTAALTGLAVRRLSAKALMNTDLSRWLAAAPRATTAQAVRAHIGRLSAIAASSPAISQEVTGLRQALLSAINDNTAMLPQAGRAAASPDQGPDQPNQ